jgi:SAM-dependent methyltransferase
MQKDTFLQSEGNAYFKRNGTVHTDLEDKAGLDPLLRVYRKLALAPKSVLEIGASTGWRLECLRLEHPRARYYGLDPSSDAVAAGRAHFPGLHLEVGTADTLPFGDNSMELIAFGFCLYLCDRADLFRIASEADRVLAPGGTIAIYDFDSARPYRNPYTHRDGLWSYKMKYEAMFIWNPAYRIVAQEFFTHSLDSAGGCGNLPDDDRLAVTVLSRDLNSAWPGPGEQQDSIEHNDN